MPQVPGLVAQLPCKEANKALQQTAAAILVSRSSLSLGAAAAAELVR
jgi:hypothetical protein